MPRKRAEYWTTGDIIGTDMEEGRLFVMTIHEQKDRWKHCVKRRAAHLKFAVNCMDDFEAIGFGFCDNQMACSGDGVQKKEPVIRSFINFELSALRLHVWLFYDCYLKLF